MLYTILGPVEWKRHDIYIWEAPCPWGNGVNVKLS